jgi:hypothetical protein
MTNGEFIFSSTAGLCGKCCVRGRFDEDFCEKYLVSLKITPAGNYRRDSHCRSEYPNGITWKVSCQEMAHD